MVECMRACAISILAAVAAGSVLADEKPVELKKAPGLEKVEAHCGSCHSLDYIKMNSPFLAAAAWDAEVAKMINAFAAPINQADAEMIATYLKANYGTDGHMSVPQRATRRKRPNVELRCDARRYYSERSSVNRRIPVPQHATRKWTNIDARRDAEMWRYYSESIR